MTAKAETLLDHLRRLVAPAALRSASDRALLAQFAHDRDQPAFTALVARHGPMVLNVCRRVLGNAQAAEDAFQAAFMVLARRAYSIRRRDSLSAWLYGVAYRVAQKARRAGLRKPTCQRLTTGAPVLDPHPDPLAELTARDLLTVLEDEVQRLPKQYRLAVALTCLDGLSVKETAQRLGLTESAVKGHLERGRARLHARLLHRGLTLAAGLSVVEAARGCLWAGPERCLVSNTVKAGMAFAGYSGSPLIGVSPEVVKLAQGVLKGSAVLKLKVVLGLTLVVAVTALGARFGALGWRFQRTGCRGQGRCRPTPATKGSRGQAAVGSIRRRLACRSCGSPGHGSIPP